MVSINLLLPDDLQARAQQVADSRGISLEEFVRSCVAQRLETNSDDPFLSDRAVFDGESPAPEADAEHIEYMRKGLEEAEQAIARGEYSEWNVDEFLAERHRRHGES